jgi:hypothetical protein
MPALRSGCPDPTKDPAPLPEFAVRFLSPTAISRLIRKKGRGLNAGDLDSSTAARVLAGHNVIKQQHIALELVETCLHPLVSSLWRSSLLPPH